MPAVQASPNMVRRQAHTDNVMLVIADLTGGPGSTVPLHQHPHDQISYIVSGEVNFIVGEGEERTVDRLGAGDVVVVPPHAPHMVEVLSESARVIDCFFPLREDFL
jgi:quercetin dioxygenase-like cupin family protein